MALVDDLIKEAKFRARGRKDLFFGALAKYIPTLESRLSGGGGGVVYPITVANGGTGQVTAAAAINALVPTQSGQSGKILGTNGTAVAWVADAGGTTLPTQTGQSGKILGTDGTTLAWVTDQTGAGGDTLPPQTGQSGKVLGTDGTNLSWVVDQVGSTLPTQTGQSGKFLTTDGTVASWIAVLPAQTGNSGKFLTTNGTVASWIEVLPALTGQGGKVLGTDGSILTWVAQSGGGGTLPAQTGHAGKTLTTDGTNASWTGYKPFAIGDVTGLQAALDAKLSAVGPGVSAVTVLAADVANTSDTARADITGLGVALLANHLYRFEFYLLYSSAAATTGIAFGFTGPAKSLFSAAVDISGFAGGGTDARWQGQLVNYEGGTRSEHISTNVVAVNEKYLAKIEGLILPTADGTLQPRFRSEVDTSEVKIWTSSLAYLSRLT